MCLYCVPSQDQPVWEKRLASEFRRFAALLVYDLRPMTENAFHLDSSPELLANRLAIDIGGTFTDIVLQWRGSLHSTKLLTTHTAPAEAVLAGVDEVVRVAGARMADIGVVLHGTTLATNALIERRGAKTALLTTQGHRDVLEMAHENRFEQYDLTIVRPTPLVPRALRLPITERMNARGDVLLPLDTASVDRAIEELDRQNVHSVAVGLLHAYANDAHETQIAEQLSAALPHLSVTLASQVCPEIREYERLSTAVANAYVQPLMAGYLKDLEQRLQAAQCTAPMLLMTSGGGLTTASSAAQFPIRLVESGPAGGAILAASHARRRGAAEVLAFDMGGTTAKLTLIDQGEPLLSRSFEVDRQYRFKKGSGLPVRIPVIEMVEIGAGGGSIAARDELNRICVGPRSAGSQPGPACYGLGGIEPAVTDADVVLGRLQPQSFAGGRMQLDSAAAERAIEKLKRRDDPVAAVELAHAVSEVVDENMAAAAKAHANEWGKDVAGRTLIAFGGAAPLHAARLARKLGLKQVVIPAGAGVGSALGFLAAPVSFEVVRSRYTRLGDFSPQLLTQLTDDMHREAMQVIAPALLKDEPTRVRRRAFMRYVGQGYEIAVELDDSVQTSAVLRERFESAYKALYTRIIPELDIEILSWTLSVANEHPQALPETAPVATDQTKEHADVNALPEALSDTATNLPTKSQWQIFDAELLKPQNAMVIERGQLATDQTFKGPALITEAQTTTYVPEGARVTCNRFGDLVIDYD